MLQEEKLVVYVGSARCREEVLVSARIVQPRVTLQLEGREGYVHHGNVLELEPLQPGQERALVFTLSNTGESCESQGHNCMDWFERVVQGVDDECCMPSVTAFACSMSDC